MHSFLRLGRAFALGLAVFAPTLSARDFVFDTVHSQIGFSISHLGFSMSQGRFKGLEGGFSFNAKHWDRSTCDIRIDINSLDLGDAAWQKKLLGKDWFAADTFPQARFECIEMQQIDAQHGTLRGRLHLRGVVREVELAVTLNRIGMHKFALQYAAGFSATTTFRRSDFGMKKYLGDIGDEVQLRIDIEAFRRKD